MPRKPYTPEQRKAARKASRLRWEAKNPDKVKDRYARRKGPKEDPRFRVCATCNEEKPIEQFKKHGPRGHSRECLVCDPITGKKKKVRKIVPKVAKQPKVPKAVTPKTADLPKLNWKQKLIADGWRYIGGETDSTEYISVFMRGFVVMYVRGATGMYSTGKCRFGVLFDNSGTSYTQLGKAENRARRLYASAS